MKILALGDVVGERTLPYLRENLGAARRNLSADLVIANGSHPELLYDIAEGRPVGTRFAGRKEG